MIAVISSATSLRLTGRFFTGVKRISMISGMDFPARGPLMLANPPASLLITALMPPFQALI